MTIHVISNAVQPVEKPIEQNEENAPALDAKVPEQNEASESETEETEAKKVEDDSEDESETEKESEESEDTDNDKPKKKGGFQRRIDKLNARNSAKDAEIEHWKQMALKSAGEPKPEPVETKPVVEGKPDPENFETHAEYVEALTDWKIEQREKSAKEQARKVELETEHEKTLKSHTERVKSFADKTEDFNDVLEAVDHIPVSVTVQEIILSSENGPELMYELAKNKDEYARICKLPPIAAARELGKLESRLSPKASEEKKTEEPKKITKAPQPIAPVGSKGGGVQKTPESMNQQEYETWRREQRKKSSSSWA